MSTSGHPGRCWMVMESHGTISRSTPTKSRSGTDRAGASTRQRNEGWSITTPGPAWVIATDVLLFEKSGNRGRG